LSDSIPYIACPRHRGRIKRSLLTCLTDCKRRCRAFEEIPDRIVREAIRADAGRHRIVYQFRLFERELS